MDLQTQALLAYYLQLADDLLILGHRNSEWCGHAPTLEEDIALGNIALDCLGQAAQLYQAAARLEGGDRDADHFVFFRDAAQYRNAHLVELPIGDFGHTMVRQFFFDSYFVLLLERLQGSADRELAEFAAKAIKETRYHLRHAAEWVIRLGDGTAESAKRAQNAVNLLWRYRRELFTPSPGEKTLQPLGISVDCSSLESESTSYIKRIFADARLAAPADEPYAAGSGREGIHTEHLGRLLSVMQSTARALPHAKW